MPATKKQEPVVIYTDGGCDPNPGIGGWGVVLKFRDTVKTLSGGEMNTTNNRMELTAAIEALEALKRPCSVVVHTDSQYLKNGITTWLPAWKRRNWTRRGGSLKNIDLWKRLDELVGVHTVQWHWVPGHCGIPENELCDELASAQIARLRNEQRG